MSSPEPDKLFQSSNREKIGDRVATSAVLLWATTMGLRLMQLLTTTVLARLLTPADYGVVALASTVTGLLEVTLNLQLAGAIIRSKSLGQDHLDTAFTLNLLSGCISAAALLIFAQPVADYMNSPGLAQVLRVLAVSALAGSIHNPYFLLYARDLDFRRDSFRTGAASVAGATISIACAFWLRNYWALVIGTLSTSIVTMSLSYWKVPGRPRLCLKHARELLSFGGWLMPVSVLNYVNNKLDYFLVGKSEGNRALGAYHIGQQITSMSTGDIVTPLSRALLPAFSLIIDDKRRLRASYREMQTIALALALPLGFGVSALAPSLVRVLVGTQWDLAIPVITFLAPLLALQAMSASIEGLALSMNKGRLLFIRTVLYLILRTGLLLAGLAYGGFLGLIYARVVAGIAFLLYGLGLAAHLVDGRWFDPILAAWRSIAAVIVMWAALILVPDPAWPLHPAWAPALSLAFKIIWGSLLYIAVHLSLWRATGSPAGAETRIIAQFVRARERFSKARRGPNS